MRVLLVNPYDVGKFGLQNIFKAEPLGLEIIGAALVSDHDVHVLDLRWDPDFEKFLNSWKPDIIGLSCLYTSHIKAVWDLAQRAKAVCPNASVVVGGQPPTLAPDFFQSSNVDYLVLGDGEFVLPELCRALEGKIPLQDVAGLVLNTPEGQVFTQSKDMVMDLPAVPASMKDLSGLYPKKYFLSLARPVALAEITRGCPYACNFCSIWKFGGSKARSRTIESVINYLSQIQADAIFFVDDHFFANVDYMMDLGQALCKNNIGKKFNIQSRADVFADHPELIEIWKEAGLNAVFLGLEGHSAERLSQVRKGTKLTKNKLGVKTLQEHGIGVMSNLMVDPTFTKEDFQAMREYVKENNYAFSGYCIATPFPGTDLWKARKNEIATDNFDLYDIQHAVLKTTLPLEEFYHEYASLWQLKKEITPREKKIYAFKRIAKIIFEGGVNLELVKNARRFERIVADPLEYIVDHEEDISYAWSEPFEKALV